MLQQLAANLLAFTARKRRPFARIAVQIKEAIGAGREIHYKLEFIQAHRQKPVAYSVLGVKRVRAVVNAFRNQGMFLKLGPSTLGQVAAAAEVCRARDADRV